MNDFSRENAHPTRTRLTAEKWVSDIALPSELNGEKSPAIEHPQEVGSVPQTRLASPTTSLPRSEVGNERHSNRILQHAAPKSRQPQLLPLSTIRGRSAPLASSLPQEFPPNSPGNRPPPSAQAPGIGVHTTASVPPTEVTTTLSSLPTGPEPNTPNDLAVPDSVSASSQVSVNVSIEATPSSRLHRLHSHPESITFPGSPRLSTSPPPPPPRPG